MGKLFYTRRSSFSSFLFSEAVEMGGRVRELVVGQYSMDNSIRNESEIWTREFNVILFLVYPLCPVCSTMLLGIFVVLILRFSVCLAVLSTTVTSHRYERHPRDLWHLLWGVGAV